MAQQLQREKARRGIIAWFAAHPVAANLLMAVAVLGGVFGYFQLNREVFPTVPLNNVNISVVWPGAAPREVEEQIVVRIEQALKGLSDVDVVRSRASESVGSVTVFGLPSANGHDLLGEITLRIDAINNLPLGSRAPRIELVESDIWAISFAVHGSIGRRELQRVAEEIRTELALEVPAVSVVGTSAVLPEEVSIEVSERELRRFGLSYDELTSAIRASSFNASAGRVRTDLGEVRLAARQLAETEQEFEEIILRQSRGGGTLRVGDVAQVEDGFADGGLIAYFEGEPMVIVFVRTTPETDVVDVSRGVREYIARKRNALPAGVDLTVWWDNSREFSLRVETIVKSAVQGGTLVLIVLFLFLRPQVAVWVTIGIFTAFGGAFLLLPLLGVSLNMLSLFAFLLVIGIVVDDAIVVGENIHARVEQGESGLDAAVIGTQLVMKPVLFAVLTTILMFSPWMMISGPTVQFTKQISLVVIAALVFSLIETLLILPAHLSHLRARRKPSGFFGLIRLQQAIAHSLIWFAGNIYRGTLALAIRHRYATSALFIGFFVVSLTLTGTNRVGTAFMPQVESDVIEVNISLIDGGPESRTEAVLAQLSNAQARLANAYETDPDIGEDIIESYSAMASGANVFAWIMLNPPNTRSNQVSTASVASQLREYLGEIPDAESISIDATINDGGHALEFALSHTDLDVLRDAADDLKERLTSYGALFDVVDSLQVPTSELQLNLRPNAQALGIELSDVTRQVRQAYYGVEVQRLPRDGRDVRVMLRLDEASRRSLDSLRDIRIRTTDGREVPLSVVAELNFQPGLNQIRRRNGLRTVTVSAQLSDPVARADINRDLAENFWSDWSQRYDGIGLNEIGDARGQQEFMAEIVNLLVIALASMYLMLAVAFRSYFQPILIMIAIPFALTGAIFGHLLFGMPIALFSYFGVGAAAGVVINDNLVLLDFVKRLRDGGMSAQDALIEAGVRRFRPILLTSVTTFLGIFPMMAEQSTQAQFLKPMVVALGFAVAFALLLTLLLVPAMYAIGQDISKVLRSVWTGQWQSEP